MNPNFVIFTFINLISIVLSIYFFFRIFEVNFNNIIVNRSYSFIEPFLRPFRMILPVIYRIDLSCLALIFFFKALGFYIFLSGSEIDFNLNEALAWTAISVLLMFSQILRYGLFISIIGSWAFPASTNQFLSLCNSITNVLLKPFQKFTIFGGMDFSPIIVFFLLIQIDRISWKMKQIDTNWYKLLQIDANYAKLCKFNKIYWKL